VETDGGKKPAISILNKRRGNPMTVELKLNNSGVIERTGTVTGENGIPQRPKPARHREPCGGSLMNIAQTCERLNVSPSTLYGWVWQRRIPFVKIGRCLRFEPHQLEEFIASNGHPQL
jgi:excisionase family DNA binding protein